MGNRSKKVWSERGGRKKSARCDGEPEGVGGLVGEIGIRRGREIGG